MVESWPEWRAQTCSRSCCPSGGGGERCRCSGYMEERDAACSGPMTQKTASTRDRTQPTPRRARLWLMQSVRIGTPARRRRGAPCILADRRWRGGWAKGRRHDDQLLTVNDPPRRRVQPRAPVGAQTTVAVAAQGRGAHHRTIRLAPRCRGRERPARLAPQAGPTLSRSLFTRRDCTASSSSSRLAAPPLLPWLDKAPFCTPTLV